MQASSADMCSCISRAWQTHHSELVAHMHRQLRDREVALDLVQEVFLRAVANADTFCALTNPRAWLFRVARNAGIDHLRRRTSVEDRLAHEDLASDFEVPAPVSRDPVAELTVCLPVAMSCLNESNREILTTCGVRGLRLHDYATTNHLSLSATKARLLRARLRLRNHLIVHCRIQLGCNGQVLDFTRLSKPESGTAR